MENNLFAYCLNNPVNMMDEGGEWPSWATKVFVAVAVTAIVVTAVAVVVATCGAAAPALAVAGGGMASGGLGVSAATAATAAAIVPIASGVATGSALAAGGSYYLAKADGKKQKKQSKKTGKEKASDAPDWAKREKHDPKKSAGDNARRILDNKYGKGKWKDGPKSEYSEIKKWLQRSKGYK